MTVFLTRMYRIFIEIQRNIREKSFIKGIRVPIFFEKIFAIEATQKPPSILEEKGNLNVLEDDFS